MSHEEIRIKREDSKVSVIFSNSKDAEIFILSSDIQFFGNKLLISGTYKK